ncbi:hypothetical protein A2U01_0087972, partial [Trifolium medium]|nr:hypothetical protein [Trifolium medium]
ADFLEESKGCRCFFIIRISVLQTVWLGITVIAYCWSVNCWRSCSFTFSKSGFGACHYDAG